VCAAKFFRQRPNFSGNLAEHIWPELATLKLIISNDYVNFSAKMKPYLKQL
jgi:hypothetical protein